MYTAVGCVAATVPEVAGFEVLDAGFVVTTGVVATSSVGVLLVKRLLISTAPVKMPTKLNANNMMPHAPRIKTAIRPTIATRRKNISLTPAFSSMAARYHAVFSMSSITLDKVV